MSELTEHSADLAGESVQPLLYPALLVVYTAGVPALQQRRFVQLTKLLLHPVTYATNGKKYAMVLLGNPRRVLAPDVLPEAARNKKAAQSTYVDEVVAPLLADLFVTPEARGDAFDQFEYFLGLGAGDLMGMPSVGAYLSRADGYAA